MKLKVKETEHQHSRNLYSLAGEPGRSYMKLLKLDAKTRKEEWELIRLPYRRQWSFLIIQLPNNEVLILGLESMTTYFGFIINSLTMKIRKDINLYKIEKITGITLWKNSIYCLYYNWWAY
ncbi:unnamed protein product [Blepharisma stoltei]|uniref:Uncharacterized protein n=1 Tax=Blepharisma stoltei TaxID=1481888 RepID=A0AAU9K3I0_9CILI|nr:unnamed protein product [Blepharisma stoltei]